VIDVARESTTDEAISARLCAGCRNTAPREELLRLAISREAPFLVPDPQRKLGGRGVSVHPTRACVSLAVKKGGFARALASDARIDEASLLANAASLYVKRAESLLLSAARRRTLAIGTEAVREAMREGALDCLVVASDAEGRREELEAGAARLGRRCAVLGTKASLGRLFGRDEVGVLSVRDAGIAAEVVRCAGIARELGRVPGSEVE
jgi:predicted RNA-binding protein YlxR (DUF448 family)